MKLVHYSAHPEAIGIVSAEQSPEGSRYMIGKPNGLWVSVEGEYDWKWWCEEEKYCLHHLAYEHEVTLEPDHNVLIVSGEQALDRFTAHFGRPYPQEALRRFNSNPTIDWVEAAKRWQGIIITPYLWERRLDRRSFWYYCWDCASGCIWDKSAVKTIELRNSDPPERRVRTLALESASKTAE